MIAIVVITHNRLHLLSECYENVLSRASPATSEIVIWDNGSTDGTGEYLRSLTDPRLRVVNHPTNIGMNGYARGFAMTTAPYMIDLDDDMIEAPAEWDRLLLEAFQQLPEIGFLAADLVDDPHDSAAHHRYRVRPHEYRESTESGIRLIRGPTGGGCAITSRELSDLVGGFRERPGEVFWLEDAEYIEKLQTAGYSAAILADLKVHHAGGDHYGTVSPEKAAYWRRFHRRVARKRAIKHVLLRVPFVARLNRRFAWFEPPSKAQS
jgi:GT2 family glycosyltransferase